MRHLLAIALLACACAAPPAADPDAAPPAIDPPADATVFTETHVTLLPDGSERVELAPITAAQERAQDEARAAWIATGRAPLLAQDPLCANASFWFYDKPELVGNRICFSGEGFAQLSKYGRPTCGPVGCYWGNWSIAAGSIYAGTEKGWLIDFTQPNPPDGGAFPQVLFAAWAHQNVNDVAGRFVYIVLED